MSKRFVAGIQNINNHFWLPNLVLPLRATLDCQFLVLGGVKMNTWGMLLLSNPPGTSVEEHRQSGKWHWAGTHGWAGPFEAKAWLPANIRRPKAKNVVLIFTSLFLRLLWCPWCNACDFYTTHLPHQDQILIYNLFCSRTQRGCKYKIERSSLKLIWKHGRFEKRCFTINNIASPHFRLNWH